MDTRSLFKFFSSLKLAVLCLLSLAAVLATATVCESFYGMRAAHLMVYGTYWFYGLLFLLGANVFCAALSRYPWKKHQSGFVITHAGILIILSGSWLTQHYGVDGNLPVSEGTQESEVILTAPKLTLIDDESRRSVSFPIPETPRRSAGRLMQIDLSEDRRLVVDTYLPRAQLEKKIVASPLAGLGVPAVRVEIFNDRFRLEEWLTVNHPDRPGEVNLGPALLTFQKLWGKKEGEGEAFRSGRSETGKNEPGNKGFLTANLDGREYRVDTQQAIGRWVRLGSTAYELKVEKYLPFAVVEKNTLVSRSNEPVNPAVQVTIRNALGASEKHTLFANFPEFATRHKVKSAPGVETPPAFGIQLTMVGAGGAAWQAASNHGGVRGKLEFAQSADDRTLYYRVRGSRADERRGGEAKVGEEVATGWMNLKFRVLDWLPSSIEEEVPHYIEYIEGSDAGLLSGLRIHEESPRNPAASPESFWLVEGGAKSVNVGAKRLMLVYARDKLNLPFSIFLKKFTIGTDPGTTKAATYESDVRVRDPANDQAPTAHISMNEPLHYGGYTFYQASYQLTEGRPPISVFSVNYDPGRWVKYSGSIIMVLGILIMFYFNPHYFGLLLSRKRTPS